MGWRCVAVGLAVIFSACGGGDAAGISQPGATGATTAAAAVTAAPTDATTADATMSTSAGTTSADASTTTSTSAGTTTTTAVRTGPGGTPLIGVLTRPDGNGERPLLEWTGVPEASNYLAVISTVDGRTYWSSFGPETAIYLGGATHQPPADAPGPYLFTPMTLQVFAFDADGVVLGASLPAPIAP